LSIAQVVNEAADCIVGADLEEPKEGGLAVSTRKALLSTSRGCLIVTIIASASVLLLSTALVGRDVFPKLHNHLASSDITLRAT
jgi:hypothetical protein